RPSPGPSLRSGPPSPDGRGTSGVLLPSGEGGAERRMRGQLEGRVAVVTGGTSGIGLALARGLAQAGADVVPISRRREQVDAAAKEVESLGRRALRVTADVKNRSSLENALRATLDAFGRVDIPVNCAGITK